MGLLKSSLKYMSPASPTMANFGDKLTATSADYPFG
jgi:hypothetical protein